MHRIIHLTRTHLALGKRELIRSYWAFPLHFMISAFPLTTWFVVSQNRIVVIMLFALMNYAAFGLIPGNVRARFSLYQIKLYPISNSTILNFLWVIELIDYGFFYLFIPSIACVVMLYPDLVAVVYYTVSISILYLFLSLALVEVKLLGSYYPSINGVVHALRTVGYIALFSLMGKYTRWNFGPIFQFVTTRYLEVLSVSCLLLVLLYLTGIFFLSRLAK
jgi:hypothetical protein